MKNPLLRKPVFVVVEQIEYHCIDQKINCPVVYGGFIFHYRFAKSKQNFYLKNISCDGFTE